MTFQSRLKLTANRLGDNVFHAFLAECECLSFQSLFKKAGDKNKAINWNEPSSCATKSMNNGPREWAVSILVTISCFRISSLLKHLSLQTITNWIGIQNYIRRATKLRMKFLIVGWSGFSKETDERISACYLKSSLWGLILAVGQLY